MRKSNSIHILADSPLIVQFAAHNANDFVSAAELVARQSLKMINIQFVTNKKIENEF